MRIRVIDAFTDRPFAGNPAAVVLLPDHQAWPDEGWMRQVAAEMKHSETAFAHPLGPESTDADWALRWFTPAVEVDLCGHATLATAHALHTDGALAEVGGSVRFRTRSGILTARVAADGTITLDFPAAPLVEAAAPEGLADALGAEPQAVHRTGALGDLLIVLADESTVRELAPEPGAIAGLGLAEDVRGLIVTAAADPGRGRLSDGPSDGQGPGRSAGRDRPQAGYDFVSRFFTPHLDIPEDPVTGSAHTALAPYWSARLGRDELVGFQVSARGGVVGTALAGDRVLLTGRAVTVLDGSLQVFES